MRNIPPTFGDFVCGHCHNLVSAAHAYSGVNNRNHCPFCLWSCHLDLFKAGDRLSACKGQMQPIGLTMKKSRNRYRLESGGELMLIHVCAECQALSINRIAADDDPESILEVFRTSLSMSPALYTACEQQGITVLVELEMVSAQLYGAATQIQYA